MSAPRTSSTIGQHIDRHDWLTAKRKERDNLGWQGGQISAWLGESGVKPGTRAVFQQELPIPPREPAHPKAVVQPDYAALGFGSAAEAAARN